MFSSRETDAESQEIGVALHIDSGEDDLDNDTGRRNLKKGPVKTPRKTKRTLSPIKSTAKTRSPVKKGKSKISVVTRLNLMQSPATTNTPSNISDNSKFVTESRQVEQEVLDAKQELLKAQQEAALARK